MKLWSLFVLNLCILIGSIPIVTIGVATSAAYAVCFKLHENNDTRVIENFILAYKRNFKQAIGFSIMQSIVFRCGCRFELYDPFGSAKSHWLAWGIYRGSCPCVK